MAGRKRTPTETPRVSETDGGKLLSVSRRTEIKAPQDAAKTSLAAYLCKFGEVPNISNVPACLKGKLKKATRPSLEENPSKSINFGTTDLPGKFGKRNVPRAASRRPLAVRSTASENRAAGSTRKSMICEGS